MNTIFKKRFFMASALLTMLLLASSCEDNLGIQVNASAPNADKTLYEIIMQDKDLTYFVEILDACNIPSPKNNNEIISVADSLFNTSRVYTVWAPVNDYLKDKKDSILERIKDGYRDEVMKTFVYSHVANFVKQAKGCFPENGESVLMLNDKKMIFAGSYKDDEGYTFGGSRLASVNERAKNGLLHKLETLSEYNYNIWEYLGVYKVAGQYKVDALVDYLYSFNDTVYPDYDKIPGPIVDGVQTYLDSAPDYRNELLTKYGGVGNLNNEDSLYTFYLPTNDVWDAMMAKAEKHFNYPTKEDDEDYMKLVDSLKIRYARTNFIKYLTYSEKEQRFVKNPDSIMPAQTEYKRKLFAREDVENCVVETKKMSNGTIKIISEYPYTVLDLWHDTIRLEAENTSYIDTDKSKSPYTTYYVAEKDMNKDTGGKLSGSGYIFYGEGDTNEKTDLYYYLPNVKSATYEVKLILVPRNVQNSLMDMSKYLDTKLNFSVYAKNANGRLVTIANKKNVVVDKEHFDTISMGTVTFPYCEYNSVKKVTEYETQIQIQGNNNPKLKKNDNNIFLDAILLVPVDEDAK